MSVSQADFDALMVQFNSLSLAHTKLETENQTLKSALSSVSASVSSSSGSRIKGALPGRFDGVRKNYCGFVGQLKFHLKLNSSYYSSDSEKVGLLISLLDGSARTWVAPYLESEDDILMNYTGFLEAFDKAFGDPHKIKTAELNLSKLRQGSRSVSAYSSEFKSVTQALGWNDSALMYHYRTGLNEQVKDELSRCPSAVTTLDALCELAASVDLRLYERRVERNSTQTYTNNISRQAAPSVSNNSQPTKPTSHSGGEPMQIDSLAKTLTPQEKQRRRVEGLCLYCGEPNHVANNCPKKGRRQQVKHGSAVTGSPSSPISSTSTIAAISPSSGAILIETVLSQGDLNHTCMTFLDCGASGNFINVNLVHEIGLEVRKKDVTFGVEAVDGRVFTEATMEVKVNLQVDDHSESVWLDVVRLPKHDIILGMPWLAKHDPHVYWRDRRLTFRSSFCRQNCVRSNMVVSTLVEIPTIPDAYNDFMDVFSKKEADKLPPHRSYDCPIDLIEGQQPPFGPIYNLSEPELQALKLYIDENLQKGFIRPSKSSCAAPVFFVPKKSGELRPVVDYRGLNRCTKKNRYPLPLIPNMLELLRSAVVFTKIDLRGAYNLVRIREGDEWKTAFRTRYGLFESLVMTFGLQNAPATFQHFVNDIFRDFLDIFVIVYLDDILIFSTSVVDHINHVRSVLARLREHRLYAKLEKCSFHVSSVEFVGFIVSTNGVAMEDSNNGI